MSSQNFRSDFFSTLIKHLPAPDTPLESIDDSPDEGYDWNNSWNTLKGKLLGEQTTLVTKGAL